jgi:hypothetical protein
MSRRVGAVVSARSGALAASALVLLAGCGQSSTEPPEDVRRATESFLSACAAGEPGASAELVAGSARARYDEGATVPESCEQVLGLGLPVSPPEATAEALRRTRITAVAVSGEDATVEVSAGRRRSRLALGQERGDWRIFGPSGP